MKKSSASPISDNNAACDPSRTGNNGSNAVGVPGLLSYQPSALSIGNVQLLALTVFGPNNLLAVRRKCRLGGLGLHTGRLLERNIAVLFQRLRYDVGKVDAQLLVEFLAALLENAVRGQHLRPRLFRTVGFELVAGFGEKQLELPL